jgi:hypothetical protein
LLYLPDSIITGFAHVGLSTKYAIIQHVPSYGCCCWYTKPPRSRNRRTHIANSGWEKGLGQLLYMYFPFFFSCLNYRMKRGRKRLIPSVHIVIHVTASQVVGRRLSEKPSQDASGGMWENGAFE